MSDSKKLYFLSWYGATIPTEYIVTDDGMQGNSEYIDGLEMVHGIRAMKKRIKEIEKDTWYCTIDAYMTEKIDFAQKRKRGVK
jgi:hypothetical protein